MFKFHCHFFIKIQNQPKGVPLGILFLGERELKKITAKRLRVQKYNVGKIVGNLQLKPGDQVLLQL